MTASIVTIGDEILIGQVVDTNSAWIANELTQLGITVNKIVTITDNEKHIIKTLKKCISKVDIVIMTGGLGPTRDDKTKNALIQFFDTKLVRDEETLKKIEKVLRLRGIQITEINRQQADMPENCKILKNDPGMVPGMLFRKNGAIVVSVPGVPYEMQSIIKNEFIPYLKESIVLPQKIVKTFLTVGIGESTLATRLEGFEDSLPDNYSLAYLPSPGLVRIRLSATGKPGQNIKLGFPEVEHNLKLVLGSDIFGYDDQTLQGVIGDLLKEHGLTIGIAESCSGGQIADTITMVPGASGYFKGSIVSYCNSVKEGVLGVNAGSLEEHGAVSEEVVIQMAEGARKVLGADITVSTSGIAGPTGGTKEKPVGTVWIGISSAQGTFAKKYYFGNKRERIKKATANLALNMLRLEILKAIETK